MGIPWRRPWVRECADGQIGGEGARLDGEEGPLSKDDERGA